MRKQEDTGQKKKTRKLEVEGKGKALEDRRKKSAKIRRGTAASTPPQSPSLPEMSNRPCSPAAAPPLEDDNLLSEILLRLPPQPSSLPRASAVSKRWHSLVSDPRFVRRFRIHHRRNPPLLGFFSHFEFLPTMDPPNCLPEACITFPHNHDDGFGMFINLGCRHGLVLFFQTTERKVLVWDTVNRKKHRIPVPPPWSWSLERVRERLPSISGAVFRTGGDTQHFQVVLVRTVTDKQQHTRAIASVYSSETGLWGDLISRDLPPKASMHLHSHDMFVPGVLVGNSLYWLLSAGILEFDLDSQRLNAIPVPVDIYADKDCQFSVMRADGGGLGFLFMSQSTFVAQLWKRKTDYDGVASWVLGRTLEQDKLLFLNSEALTIRGYAEENNMVLLHSVIGLFTFHLDLFQFKKLCNTEDFYQSHPFESVYTPRVRRRCWSRAHDGGLGV